MSEYDDRTKWSDEKLLDEIIAYSVDEYGSYDVSSLRAAILRRMGQQQEAIEDEFDYIITIDDKNVKYEYRLHGSGEYSIQGLIDIIVSHTNLSEVSCERVIAETQPEADQEPELLPCPFCGGKAELKDYKGGYSVDCKNSSVIDCALEKAPFCELNPKTELHETKEEAIEVWNSRVPKPSVVEKQLAEVMKILTYLVEREYNTLVHNLQQ